MREECMRGWRGIGIVLGKREINKEGAGSARWRTFYVSGNMWGKGRKEKLWRFQALHGVNYKIMETKWGDKSQVFFSTRACKKLINR